MRRALFFVVATVFALATAADDAVQVQTELIAEVRETVQIAPDRKTYRYVPATVMAQGRVVYYTVRIRNPATVYARDVVVIQPIPANTTYVPGSAAGPGAETSFSVDGGETFISAVALAAATVDSSAGSKAAGCTHIRWELRNPLAPGAVALARFRAVFN